MSVLRKFNVVIPRYIAVRCMATAQPTDPIQKLFVDKIRDYKSKSQSSPNGLVGATADTLKALTNDVDRVANSYGIKDEKNIGNLGLKFEETTTLDSINLGGK